MGGRYLPVSMKNSIVLLLCIFGASVNIFLPIILAYVLGAQKNRLIETVLLSTHNMFWMRNKKNIFLLHTLN